jgi:hypothetical protein
MKLQLEIKRKAIFESNEPTPDENNIQRKCAGCEDEEKLQKKEEESEEETPFRIET